MVVAVFSLGLAGLDGNRVLQEIDVLYLGAEPFFLTQNGSQQDAVVIELD